MMTKTPFSMQKAEYVSPSWEVLFLLPETSLMRASEGEPEQMTIISIEYDD